MLNAKKKNNNNQWSNLAANCGKGKRFYWRQLMNYAGHVMRGSEYVLLKLIFEGKICGKRWSPARHRTELLKGVDDLRRWQIFSYCDV